jgi:hypothetical protein
MSKIIWPEYTLGCGSGLVFKVRDDSKYDSFSNIYEIMKLVRKQPVEIFKKMYLGQWYTCYGCRDKFDEYESPSHSTGDSTAPYGRNDGQAFQIKPRMYCPTCSIQKRQEWLNGRENYLKTSRSDSA